MKLPKGFINQMEVLLKDEAPDFFESLEKEKRSGLRVNTLKISVEDFLSLCPFELEPVPWTLDGFYFKNGERPAKHPYYHCGLYYIQEPSAMAPVSVMAIKEGDVILDLCAAPGGKTIQIAAKLKHTGTIITNDISTGRVKALVKNVELYGVKNAIVLNENHEKIANKFSGVFDGVLIDAPCSGEGMFRKDKNAVDSWESHGIDYCNAIQREIVDVIPNTLKDGGELVYSTCTFNKIENEETIDYLIHTHPEFTCVSIDERPGFVNGYSEGVNETIINTKRLFPHQVEGEGHYLAELTKSGEKIISPKVKENMAPEEFVAFMKDNLTIELKGKYLNIKDKIYLLPENNVDTSGLRVARSGWLLGEIKRGRFKPSQSMAMGLKKEDARHSIDISSTDENAIRYLKGETITLEGEKGLNLITIDGFPVGWGRLLGRTLKNDYPPSWRYM